MPGVCVTVTVEGNRALMAEVLESHLREEFGEAAAKDAGIQQAIALVRSYLK